MFERSGEAQWTERPQSGAAKTNARRESGWPPYPHALAASVRCRTQLEARTPRRWRGPIGAIFPEPGIALAMCA